LIIWIVLGIQVLLLLLYMYKWVIWLLLIWFVLFDFHFLNIHLLKLILYFLFRNSIHFRVVVDKLIILYSFWPVFINHIKSFDNLLVGHLLI
jgi:hypothetical protein